MCVCACVCAVTIYEKVSAEFSLSKDILRSYRLGNYFVEQEYRRIENDKNFRFFVVFFAVK